MNNQQQRQWFFFNNNNNPNNPNRQLKADRPQLRAAKFMAMTRENLQTLPSVAAVENATVSFDLPRARLLARIQLLVEATFTVTHATATTFTPATFAPYNILRRVQVDLNNGFSSFKISGKEAYLYNMMHFNAHTFERSTVDPHAQVYMTTAAAAAPGATNELKFTVDLPIALNDRDPIGLILLQNEETQVVVTIDVGRAVDLLADPTGYTVELVSMSITPVLQTFTIPVDPEALPDLSILKLVHSMSMDFVGAGVHVMKLPVGLTYRKLILYIEDAAGGIPEDRLTKNIEVIFNQADIPYSVDPKVLRALNIRSFGKVLPVGTYIFDWSDQGLTNYGGSRDYIDTERLTEFWVSFGTDRAGRITAVYEVLSRLVA